LLIELDCRMRLLLLIAVVFASPALASPPSSQEAELAAGLFNWAIKLSGYPRPSTVPVVEFVPQAFFDASACGGRSCRVWGWYPNSGKAVVYVHERARDLIAEGSDARSLLAASIVVHEFTHFLQAANRGFAVYDCETALQLEREAYSVQNAYLSNHGSEVRVRVSMHDAGCERNARASRGDGPVIEASSPHRPSD
jgi:hypothetical protein